MGRAIRNIIIGMGSILDFAPQRRTSNPSQADAEALRKDWEQVGADMWSAMGKVCNGQ